MNFNTLLFGEKNVAIYILAAFAIIYITKKGSSSSATAVESSRTIYTNAGI